MDTTSYTVDTAGTGPVEVTVTGRGSGRPVLLLHGGAGPLSVGDFADLLARTHPVRVYTPTHPGFGGTPRPEALASVRDLAAVYAGLLDALDLTDVVVIGNSIGGWIAAELALTGTHRLGGVVLVDAVGIEVPGEPVADFFSLTLDQVAEYSYVNPDRFRIDPGAMPEPQRAAMAGNRASLAVYAGGPAMADPGLRARLAEVRLPFLVIWGEADRIATPTYGRAWAQAVPGGRFELLPGTGHVPQVETPDLLSDALAGALHGGM